MPLGNLLGPIGVLCARQPRLQFREVGADFIEVLRLILHRFFGRRFTHLNRKNQCGLFHHIADGIIQRRDLARNRCGQSVLHFHRFQNDQFLTEADGITDRHIDGVHHRLHRCFDGFRFTHFF